MQFTFKYFQIHTQNRFRLNKQGQVQIPEKQQSCEPLCTLGSWMAFQLTSEIQTVWIHTLLQS